MSIVRGILFVGFAFASECAAQPWLPLWSGVQPINVEHARPLDVQVAPDGSVFVGAQFTRSNQGHAALLRFDDGGGLAWMRDAGTVSETAGIERLRSGQVTVFGVPWSGAGAFVSVYADGGEPVWAHEPSLGRLNVLRQDLHQLVEAANGDVLLNLSDQGSGDYVVARYAADGSERPAWRHAAGAHARATDIAALADGGAVVTGIGIGLGGGYTTVRFDADGNARFGDLEPGDHGSPLGPAYVAVDADGGIVLAGTPEDGTMGVPEATVWKLDANGARSWKRVLGVDAEYPFGRDLFRFRLAANGDALLVTDGGGSASERLHLVRIAGADGRVLWDRVFSFSIGFGQFPPYGLAEAPNGRILLVGFVKTEHSTYARLIEFGADGEPCRQRDDESLHSVGAAVGSEHGWSVAAAGPDGLVAQRFDADGACDRPDPVFVDGFDGVGAR
jgi:hypothetical protein